MEDLVDRCLPELIFHMEEIRALVRKYTQVIQRYYVQYLSGYDAVALGQAMQVVALSLAWDVILIHSHDPSLLQGMTGLSEENNVLLSSICQTISDLSVDLVEDPDHVFNFRGLRLDWTRLQSYVAGGPQSREMLSSFKVRVLWY